MASLLSWLGHTAKKVEHNLTHNVVTNVVGRDVVKPVVHQAQGAVAQVNPLDSGRTYHTVMDQGANYAPRPAASVLNQITHNGFTNSIPRVPGIAGSLGAGTSLAALRTLEGFGSGIISAPSQAAHLGAFGVEKLTGAKQYSPQTTKLLAGIDEATHVVDSPLHWVENQTDQAAKAYGGPGAAIYKPAQVAANIATIAPGVVSAVPKAASVAEKAPAALKAATPEAVAHRSLMASNPKYGELQANLERSTKAVNKINQNGESKVALKQHLKNIDDIQKQMIEMRRSVSQGGFARVPQKRTPATPERQPLPENIVQGKAGVKTTSSASIKPSSKGGASVSRELVAEENPVAVPKTSPQQDAISATQRNGRRVQPGSEIAVQGQTQRLAELRRSPAGQLEAQNPSSNYTPATARERGFGQSVKNSPEVSPTVAKRAGSAYQVRNTEKLAQKADTFAGGNLSKATEAVSSSLGKKRGNISDQEVANAITVAKRHDANKNYAQATDIYENLSKHLTKQGQAIQAASLLDRRTPEGLRYQITKVFKKAGVTPSKEVNDAIEAKMQDIRATKPGTPERILATKQLQKIVGDSLPSTPGDKAIAFWKAGLLTGARTQTGNLLSNETFSLLHNASNPLAAGLDKAVSLVTGQRTKTLTGKGLVSGTIEGTKRAGTYFKTGIDERAQLTNKFDSHQVNFKNKALDTYVNGVFRLMGAADRPHYYRQLHNSLADLAKADGLNRGLHGNALSDHITNFVKDPPAQAFQLATNEAEKAVLANDTILSKAVSKLRQVSEDAESPVGKAITEAAINLIMPFTKVPSAFISRVVDYTPVGAIKTIAGQISRKQFDQRALVTAISEATTGAGVMYLGSKLAEANMLSGDYPNDPREQQRWKAQGIQPNSIKVGGQWVNMNYLGPLGLLFAAGGRIADTKQQGGNWLSQQAQAYAGMPKDLTQQSFLQGLSGSLQAINEPGRYLNNYVKSQTGSIVPTLSGDIATATDPKQRQTDTPLDAIKSRIPGARLTLKPAQDVYGNQLDRKTSPISSLVNPLRPTTDTTDKNPVVAEVSRLHTVDPSNPDLQVTPTQVNKSISVEGKQIKLSNQQRYDLQKQIGQTTQNAWGKLIKTPEYKALDDAGKAQALSNLRSTASTLATRRFVTSNNLATYSKAASAKVSALGSGTADLASYATSSSGGGSNSNAAYYKSPDAEYKTFLQTYNQDVKSGSYSAAQKITATKKLDKLKVGAVYPKDVRDLYSLSKSDLYSYLTKPEKGVDKKKIGDQLLAYDKALYDAGLTSYRKYKTGLAPASKHGRKAGSKSSGKKAAKTGLSTALSTLSKIETAVAPPKAPANPHITVKTNGLPSGYKQSGLKQYAVKKQSVGKTNGQ
jgi:hypothetical protein